jgi:signal transduction histidine kinase
MKTAATFDVRGHLADIGRLTGQGLPRDKFLAAVLDVLVRMGFDRARYYEKVRDVVRSEDVLVLVAATEPAPETQAGYRVDWDSSTVVATGAGCDAAIGSALEGPMEGAPWIGPLGLTDRSWVEIPVTAGQEIVGLLAADWTGAPESLVDDDLDALRVVGAQVGSHLRLKPIAHLSNYEAQGEAWPKDAAWTLVTEAATSLQRMLDAAVVAIFAFSWPEQQLYKAWESIHPEIGRDRPPALREVYRVGEHLTGRAWLDPGVRHVVDFESLDRFGPELIADESMQYHQALLGDVRSVMYLTGGQLDRRYLLRFINRASSSLPFLHEFQILDALGARLGAQVDTAVATQRSVTLRKVVELTSRRLDPAALVNEIGDFLREELIRNFFVLGHQEESAQYGFASMHGPRLQGVEFDVSKEWASDPLYVAAQRKGGIVLATDFERGASPLADILRSGKFRAVHTVGILAGRLRGALFVPLDVAPRGATKSDPPHWGFGTDSLLHAYAMLIGNAVEAQHDQARVDGARRALGLIGHELRSPLQTLNSEVEQSLLAARYAIRESHLPPERTQSLLVEVEQHEQTLFRKQHTVSSALELAPLVAQESEGSLQLHFARTSLLEVMRAAVDQVAKEAQLEARGRYAFNLAPSVDALPAISCDEDRIRHVFVNVLRNAVKYSLPRSPGRPMEIDVGGQAQARWCAITVHNWGLGIPEDRRDLIFEPWVRGDVKDEKKAIRGMGLGLFLARRILAAHEGQILLFATRPTLDDPERTHKLEGFSTTFEVRIPNNLPRGTYRHRWGEGRSSS